MKKKIMHTCLISVFAAGISASGAFAKNEDTLKNEAEQIIKLLISCRAVIAQHQELFNNPDIGDKGFTGEVYKNKIIEHFKNETGMEISEKDATPSEPLKKALGTILISAKEVIDENQGVLNEKGKGFKNIIPARVGRSICNKFTASMGGDYLLKQTSLMYRNLSNRPDFFEARVLEEFEAGKHPKSEGKGVVRTNPDGTKVYRYIFPLYIEPACLLCHGEPKGSRDISGRIKEGYKEGEVRGAISAAIPYSLR
ncbi:MAG: Tll0287-like domain-containing protein [Candidatus Loosdrechtia sp.]|uniref:Tll0287-like domain-containing protein n=1 Tax=Candidatus Loosdrechtia sp. TaxID=3101272 RepID=UPI003A60023C|nr:MAG: DUF3365 domain-containing protein [Candidatus Jettenia sp. AMX2]